MNERADDILLSTDELMGYENPDVSYTPEQFARYMHSKWWRLNHLYWLIDEDGKKFLFRHNFNQEWLWKHQWYLNLLLKARQFGGTTWIDLCYLDDCLFIPDLEAGIIAHKKDDAAKIFRRKVQYPYKNLPVWLKEQRPLTTDSRTELSFNNNSIIYVDTSVRSGTVQRLHICLSGDMEILTKNGIVKKITDIKAGDAVLTSSGAYQRVRALAKNKLADLKENLLAIHTFGYYSPLKLTERHKVLTREHKTGAPIWKPAGDLKPGDYIAYPTREVSLKSRDGLIPFGSKKYSGTFTNRGKNTGTRICPDFNLGWLSGFYLAEGTIRRRNGNPPSDVQFSIHEKETNALIERLNLLGLVNKSKGELIHCYDHPSKTRAVTVNSKDFAWFLEERFGGSDNKHIPDSIWNLGAKFVRGLIKGYFDGDGSYEDVTEVQATSTRRQILDQLRLLLISMRYGYPSIYQRDAGAHYGRQCKEIWVLKLYGEGNWKYRKEHSLPLPQVNTWTGKWRIDHGRNPSGRKNWRRGKCHYWARIGEVEHIPDEKYVYDLALEDSPHDYVTVNGVVHNSEFGKICAKYPEKAQEIVTGSLNAIHQGNNVWIESTAEGAYGYFFDMCEAARNMQKEGQKLTMLDYKFHFIPWYQDPKNALSDEDTALVNITSEMREYFDKVEAEMQVTLTANQKAWYVKKDATMGENMFSEFPSTPDEPFHVALKGAYYAKVMTRMREQNRITIVPIEPDIPINTLWDLGRSDENSIVFHQRIGLQNRFVDYYENFNESIGHYVKVLQEKGYVYGMHYFPHDMNVHDWSREDGKSRIQVFQDLMPGARTTVVNRGDLMDGIEDTRNFLATTWIDKENCAHLIKCLDSYQREFDDKLGGFRQIPLHNWACLAGDTKIRTLGGWVTIKELAGKEFYVWGYSEAEHRLVPAKAERCWKAKRVDRVVEVTLDVGDRILCTPDHLFLTRQEEWVEAMNLTPGDSLMPFYESINRGYVRVHLNDGSLADEHKYVYATLSGGFLEEGNVIHHKDSNKFNNDPNNLQSLTMTEHISIHASEPERLAKLKINGGRGKGNTTTLIKVNKMRVGDNHHTRQEGYWTKEQRQRNGEGTKKVFAASERVKQCVGCGADLVGNYKRLYCCTNCKSAARGNHPPLEHSTDCMLVDSVNAPIWTPSNHKVKAVRIINETMDVYDISVPSIQNFVAEGVIVHNCHGADAVRTGARGYVQAVPQTRIKRRRRGAMAA